MDLQALLYSPWTVLFYSPVESLFIVAWTLGGVATHYAFGVNTMLGYYLGLNPLPVRAECA
jgi:hypothetical protein